MKSETTGNEQAIVTPGEGRALPEAAPETLVPNGTETVAAAQPFGAAASDNGTPGPAAEPKAEEKVGSKPIDPENLSRQLRAIERQEKSVGKLRDEWENLKELTASAKKAYDEGVEKLCEIIRRHNAPAPLFDDPALRQPTEGGQSEGENMPDPIQDADAWRSVPIADLEPKLTAGKLKVLAEHVPPITTMGEMADWQQAKGDFWVKDLKGFGPGGAEQYELAATRYFEEHPREPKAPIEPPSATAEDPRLVPDPWAADWSETFPVLVGDAAEFQKANGGTRYGADSAQAYFGDLVARMGTDGGAECWQQGVAECQRWFGSQAAFVLSSRIRELIAIRQLESSAPRPVPENQVEQALAAAPDDIDPHTANRVASFIGDNARFTIEVAQRANGQWAEQHTARIGDGRKHTCDSTGWQGRHVTRGEAIAVAADTIDEWAKGLQGTSATAKAGVKEIRKQLDKLDRAHADDPGGAADSNRQAVAV